MSRRSRWHLSTSAAKWTTCTRQSTLCREWEAQWHVAAPLSGKQRSAQRGDPGPGCSGQSTAGYRPSAECRPAGSTDSVKQRRKKDGSCATRRCGRACDHAENLTREIRSSFCTKSAMHQSQRGTSHLPLLGALGPVCKLTSAEKINGRSSRSAKKSHRSGPTSPRGALHLNGVNVDGIRPRAHGQCCRRRRELFAWACGGEC